MIKTFHSYWAYLVLIVLAFAVLKAFFGFLSKKDYTPKMFQLALLTLIVTHIQFLIAIVLYFTSSRFSLWTEVGISEVMKTSVHRLYLVEHPFVNILAIVIITIGYSKHKRKRLSNSKFKTLSISYLIAFLLILSRIPWDVWPAKF
jgi:hypothetical protein